MGVPSSLRTNLAAFVSLALTCAVYSSGTVDAAAAAAFSPNTRNGEESRKVRCARAAAAACGAERGQHQFVSPTARPSHSSDGAETTTWNPALRSEGSQPPEITAAAAGGRKLRNCTHVKQRELTEPRMAARLPSRRRGGGAKLHGLSATANGGPPPVPPDFPSSSGLGGSRGEEVALPRQQRYEAVGRGRARGGGDGSGARPTEAGQRLQPGAAIMGTQR